LPKHVEEWFEPGEEIASCSQLMQKKGNT